jgi:hypothetical protein
MHQSLTPGLSYSLVRPVFDVIGTPSEAEIAQIENSKLRRCIAQLERKPPQALTRRYPTMPDA